MELKVNLTISNYNDLALLDEVLKRVKSNANVDVEVVDPEQSVQQTQVPTQQPVQSVPVQTVQQTVPVQQPAVATTQSVPGQTAVPVAEKAYTLEDLQRASSTLVQAGKIQLLQGLLQEFNSLALTALHVDQYGAFALRLRELGAAI